MATLWANASGSREFSFIAKHRGIWAVDWMCQALGVSRGGLYAWLTRPRSQRSRSDEELGAKVRASFLASDRTYGARRVWRDLLADELSCGLHRIERLMRLQALKARPRRRRLPPDLGERPAGAVAANVLDRAFEAAAPNRKWIADFTYVWTAEGWLYVAAVIDLFSRRVVGWSMSAAMTAQLVTDALVMAIWRRGKPDFFVTFFEADFLRDRFFGSGVVSPWLGGMNDGSGAPRCAKSLAVGSGAVDAALAR